MVRYNHAEHDNTGGKNEHKPYKKGKKMNTLTIDFTNCFGIEALAHEFDFSTGNVFSIYARNGLMKTSFAKTFQLLQQGNNADIGDKIFNNRGNATVMVDGNTISQDQIFVVKSYESSYESDISSLLIKGQIKEQLQEVFKARTKLLKALEKSSGLKIKKSSQGKPLYELEPQIVKDFAFAENSILMNLTELVSYMPEIQCGDVLYSTIFDPTVLKKIHDRKFQDGIADYISASDEIYSSFAYLEKGQLTLPKLKDLKKSLEKNSFFVKDNHISLSGQEDVVDVAGLNRHISNIEAQIKQSPAYQEIEKLLADAKGTQLKDVIELHPEIVGYLAVDKLDTLKKSLWSSYLKENESLLTDLYKKYQILSDAIDAVSLDDTPWKQALDIFDQRFTVPFSMSIANLKGAIIGESVPQVEFTFARGADKRTIDRSKLEELDTLSQGEKRALYLLNIIFDIEQLKSSGKEVVLIIDDIADSFDYKNKYAIIEYLYELAQEHNFYMLILTHNFDFHRTVSNRLGLDRSNRLMADLNNASLILEQEHYQKQPFDFWKNNPTEKHILALIPFVRNLIEYGTDQDVSQTGKDYTYLTSLLHEKSNSHMITFADIEPLYQAYIGVNHFDASITRANPVLEKLYSICDSITISDTKLENKIVLAIGIRHKAEEFMIHEITRFEGQLNWRDHRNTKNGTSTDFLTFVTGSKNQTRELIKGYQQFGDREKIAVLNKVSIMTPEHIHINSFMYEPLLDMDITELLFLYQHVKELDL